MYSCAQPCLALPCLPPPPLPLPCHCWWCWRCGRVRRTASGGRWRWRWRWRHNERVIYQTLDSGHITHRRAGTRTWTRTRTRTRTWRSTWMWRGVLCFFLFCSVLLCFCSSLLCFALLILLHRKIRRQFNCLCALFSSASPFVPLLFCCPCVLLSLCRFISGSNVVHNPCWKHSGASAVVK